MNRIILAGALSCALAVSACNTTGATIGSSVGSAVGTVVGAQVSNTTITKAQSIAKTACAFLPAAESLRELYAASSGTLATASSLASVACSALTAGTAYAADDGRPAKRARPKKGETITGTAVVDGKPVTVTGTTTK